MSANDSTVELVRPRTTLVVIGVILAGFGLSLLQRGLLLATADRAGRPADLVTFDFMNWVLWLALSPAIVIAARRWPLRVRGWLDLACHAGGATALSVVHTILFSVSQRLLFRAPGSPSILDTATGLLSWRLAIDVLVYATIVSAVLAIDASGRAHAQEGAALRSRAESTQARLAALELQIQPHFLFNTLNTAAMLARMGRAEESATVITRLSELLRELVADAPGEAISLRQELAFVARYLEIEKTRFGERLRSSIEATPEAMSVSVPRLLLQPLVENAVRHGLQRSPSSGMIEVRAALERPDLLLVTIADDGPGVAPVSNNSSHGLGLMNTRSRLTALFGERSSLTMSRRPDGGMLVTIRLPVAS